MNYIEDIFVCLAMPLLVAAFCTDRATRRSVLFMLFGMSVSLLSAYISTFLAGVVGASTWGASVEVAPVVEEIMKLLPILFYLVVFNPDRKAGTNAILMTAIGFATFENVCYLTENSASNLLYMLMRGAGTGAMHVVCGLLISLGLLYLWDIPWLKAIGTLAILCVSTTYHGIYNLLVSTGGKAAVTGFLLPMMTTAILLTAGRRFLLKMHSEENN